ncbi:MAG TPA: putative protein N(5)-glutamine methyltransferase [Micrococcales bacterium]|uniref:putative protein N(5)-glutamine methyltransferase n=1 Tax=Miniimonas TaxID=947525 RepID=UPI000D5276CB|nr:MULTISPECIES: putative protein N(5)-glutamine methyltransferase [Miniimonas]HCX85355.1 putative protein N(5)-glutamine methyltransferase [Micrococcales bacterium]
MARAPDGEPDVGPDPALAALVTALRGAGCVFAEEEAALLAELPAPERAAALSRRVAGEPLEHVLGWAELAGVRVAVGPGVFVPRRRTEALVAQAQRLLTPDGVLLDLCCGSGAVARVLAERCRPARVHASDVDAAAVAVAAVNLAGLGTVSVADVVDGVPPDLRGTVTVLTANVPYVPTRELDLLPRDVREHEPRFTHDGGADGLDLLRRVLTAAVTWLAPGGVALSEVAPHQVGAALEAAYAVGLVPGCAVDDERDVAVLLARRPDADAR